MAVKSEPKRRNIGVPESGITTGSVFSRTRSGVSAVRKI
jgi:hypothetical protein